MTCSAVAVDLDESLDVQSYVAFHHQVLVDILTQFGCLVLGQVSDTGVGVYSCCSDDIFSGFLTDTENVGQSDFNTFFSW